MGLHVLICKVGAAVREQDWAVKADTNKTEPVPGAESPTLGKLRPRDRLDGRKLTSQRRPWQAGLLLMFDRCVTVEGAPTDTRREQGARATHGPAASLPLNSSTSSGCCCEIAVSQRGKQRHTSPSPAEIPEPSA